MTTAQTFLLPDLGEGLTEAEIVRWLVAVGDVVVVDAPVAEVETAKSIVEVPSPYAGVVAELHGAEGSTVDVGKPLITIGVPAAGEDTAAVGSREEDKAAEAYRKEEQAGSGNVLIGYGTAEGARNGRRRKPRTAVVVEAVESSVPLVISPLVRRMARDAKVDLREVSGSGAGGLIVRRDVEAAIAGARPDAALARGAGSPSTVQAPALQAPAAQVPAAQAPGAPADSRTGLPELRRIPMSGFRKAAAATLSRSRAEIPEATTWVDVDATALVELRESLRTSSDPGPGLLALMARFVVAGLQKYPELNGFVDTEREELVQYDGINLGLAAQTERGLVVPAVVGAHALTTRGLDAEIRRLTGSAREGRLTANELSCGTFTLNNYGSFGVDGSAAIINHPQVAILGVGRIIDRPWVVDGELAIRKLTQLSLVFDHRVCDGGLAAGFLRFVADAFESPTSAFADL
ncbi:pyruvate dehydrogenase E2 component (dihydrolipoamide acetyltransferase) [Kribbella orskensis]|uniref:Dihydrolipoamide acetyltransferase component of pyruvate dehydrogenase complex n=1 Tax=Kribbella orskensis TaxID=2512216 RepID=A0ABY2BJX6_9ACTN|nr:MULTISPECIES: dihydrolipoamide acetyltransferase family protein [Kribbella]TCN40153.1 pyruvate dehydrogenase E2 component (dihydrolipoamide acetyltransferase) [Kribbella sp. VKM Ac-2500]TCO22773.1 pyruvate dehydrogenase E2 component (dihydrolipoamide acetyltransferase) [Kribbella orskensis]